jgi:PTH1 family peptidyl-tRNA hydrolase
MALRLARGLRRRDPREEREERVVVVGLGNPGPRYELTRHNAGAMVLAVLAGRTGIELKGHKRSRSLVGDTILGGQRVVLARPLVFMNESGGSVRDVARWYGADPEDIVVLHDELDIAFGQVRVKRGGGTAGHNGLKSVGAHLGTKDFARVRIGISRPAGNRDAADWVLAAFSATERKELPEILERAADAVEHILEAGLEAAMNEYNGGSGGRRPRTPDPRE